MAFSRHFGTIKFPRKSHGDRTLTLSLLGLRSQSVWLLTQICARSLQAGRRCAHVCVTSLCVTSQHSVGRVRGRHAGTDDVSGRHHVLLLSLLPRLPTPQTNQPQPRFITRSANHCVGLLRVPIKNQPITQWFWFLSQISYCVSSMSYGIRHKHHKCDTIGHKS